jgi:hypothetical protein
VIDAIFSRIGGGFVKSYLFAGLLPSAFILLASFFYFGGYGSTLNTLSTAISTPAKIAWLIAGWMAIGLVLFSLRTPILALFEMMPRGRLTRPLLNRQLARRSAVERLSKTLAWDRGVAEWYVRNFEVKPGAFREPWMATPDPIEAVQNSASAREIAGRLLAPSKKWRRRPLEWCRNIGWRGKILDGLTSLYLVATDPERGSAQIVRDELEKWRQLAKSNVIKELLGALAEDKYREWIVAKTKAGTFPEGVWVHPTYLGNKLAALDDYSEGRYGIDTSTLWTRLWFVLPQAVRDEVSDEKLNIEVCINLAVASILVAFLPVFGDIHDCSRSISILGLRCVHFRYLWFLFALALAFFAYRGAVLAVSGMAGKMKALIDLYRLRVLAALGFRPATIADELALFKELQRFLAQANERNPHRYLTVDFDWIGEKAVGSGKSD